jgi:exosortase
MRNDSAHPGSGGWHAGRSAALACAAAGVWLFQFYGNSTLGYIKSASLFRWWGGQWLDPRAESEHGWLILGLSAWLWWRNLQPAKGPKAGVESGAPPPADHPGRWALAALLGGLALHAVGFAAQQARVSIVALLIFSWGVLALAGGARWGRAALFPLAFLIFAIPINVLDSVGFWLRLWVIEASALLASIAGIDVLRSGTQLFAPDGRYNYDVAAACSGVRSLTALSALSLLVGYLSFEGWWRRAFVLFLCLPLVYVGNVARIAAIIFAAQWGGSAWGARAHDIMGYGVFVIVLGGVLGTVTLMQRWWPEVADDRRQRAEGGEGTGDRGQGTVDSDTQTRELPRTTALPLPSLASLPSLQSPRLRSPGWAVPVVIVALALGEAAFLHHLATSPDRGEAGVVLAADELNPVELPAFLGTDWIGRRAEVTPIEREILPADTGFSRKVYVSLAEPRRDVLLSVVLSGRDRTSIHRPELCLVGQGWTIDAATRHQFQFPSASGAAGSFPSTVLEVRREMASPHGKVIVPQLAVYWFVDSRTVVATHWERLLRDAWNRVTRARADRWAYVLMQTDSSDGKAAALARMQQILDDTLPAFQRVSAARKP